MQRWPDPPQVLVVGGGPAGASTAWHLAQQGVDVLLVDRAVFPRDKPCGEYLSPEASRILHSMGALQLVEKSGAAQLTGMSIYTRSGAVIRGAFVSSHGFRGFRDCGLAIRRPVLDAILLDRARSAGVRVVEGAKVEQLLQDSTGTCRGVVLRHHGQHFDLAAQVVIGADGLRSVVARRLHLAHTSRFTRRFAIVTHFSGVRDITSRGEMFTTRGAYLGVCHVGGGLANVALVVSQPPGSALADSPEALLRAFINTYPGLRGRFDRATMTHAPTVTGPFASHARRGWAPGAALVGDAADFFDPFTGEGIFAALRGGELLAPFIHEALATRTAVDASRILQAYDKERHRVFAGKWRVERLIGLGISFPWLFERAASILQRDAQLADLLVGVAGDFVPARELLRVRVLRRLLTPKSGLPALSS